MDNLVLIDMLIFYKGATSQNRQSSSNPDVLGSKFWPKKFKKCRFDDPIGRNSNIFQNGVFRGSSIKKVSLWPSKIWALSLNFCPTPEISGLK